MSVVRKSYSYNEGLLGKSEWTDDWECNNMSLINWTQSSTIRHLGDRKVNPSLSGPHSRSCPTWNNYLSVKINLTSWTRTSSWRCQDLRSFYWITITLRTSTASSLSLTTWSTSVWLRTVSSGSTWPSSPSLWRQSISTRTWLRNSFSSFQISSDPNIFLF